MLQTLKSSYPDLCLLVPGILAKLLHEHVSQEEPSTISPEAHLLCWGYNDGMVAPDGDEVTGEFARGEGKMEIFTGALTNAGPRSIAFDGQFVYVTSSSLTHMLKIGTGKQGTIRYECKIDYKCGQSITGWPSKQFSPNFLSGHFNP